MPKISFDIKFLNYFVSDKIAGNKDFEQSFDLSHIPPLQRRRYSTLAKCLFSKMPEFSDECVIVFASHTGEINRCFTLLKELKDTELISPVSFSLSVLNSAPALVAIEKQNHNEITAISSNLPFENALISAVSKMKDEAFVVVYDELLGDDKEPEDYAFLAMQICRGDKFELEFSSNLMIDNKADKSYLRFLRALKSKAKGYEFSSNSLNFKWTLK